MVFRFFVGKPVHAVWYEVHFVSWHEQGIKIVCNPDVFVLFEIRLLF